MGEIMSSGPGADRPICSKEDAMALSNGIRRAPPDNQQVFKDGRDSRSFGAKGEWAVGWRIGPLPKNPWGSELESGKLRTRQDGTQFYVISFLGEG